MANISITNDEGIGANDGKQEPLPPIKCLIIEPQHLMISVDVTESGIRHLTKAACNEVGKYDKVVLEHKSFDGRLIRRVLKNDGKSVIPWYEDEEYRRIEFEIKKDDNGVNQVHILPHLSS